LDKLDVLACLLAAVIVLVLLAKRLQIPSPIALVLGGLAMGFIPHLPRVTLPPNLVLFVFLPPLIYAQAITSSWRDFVRLRRPILLLAVGLVLTTTGAVAWAAHTFVPGLPWAAAFALGAIVAPTDPVAAAAIVQRLQVPRSILTVLTGESLINDGASLVAYKLAVAAAVTGQFSAVHAGGVFVWSSLGGIGVGLLLGWAIGAVRRRLKPDPTTENAISLLSPFAAYLPAEALGVSGVLAVVALGLSLGRQSSRFMSASTRLQAGAVWGMVDFLLNSTLFILVGLQLRSLLERVAAHHLPQLALETVLVCITVVAVRLVYVFAAAYLPRVFSPQRGQKVLDLPWQQVTMVAWTGMRGGISLAAALALPLTASGAAPFPQRDLLIFLTFAVILSTLVVQGLSLPWLIGKLGLTGDGEAAQEEAEARRQAGQAGLARLDEMADAEDLPGDLVEDLRGHFERMTKRYAARADGEGDSEREEWASTLRRVRRRMVEAERDTVIGLRDDGTISDEVLQRIQQALDLDERRLGLEEDGEE
jgi:Na+/H+ antiporter